MKKITSCILAIFMFINIAPIEVVAKSIDTSIINNNYIQSELTKLEDSIIGINIKNGLSIDSTEKGIQFENQNDTNGDVISLYNELNQELKEVYVNLYGIEDSFFTKCSNEGYSVSDAVSLNKIMTESAFSFEEAKAVLKAYATGDEAVFNVTKYSEFIKKETLSLEKTSEFKSLMLKGYDVEGIEGIYYLSEALQLNMNVLVKDDTNSNSKEILASISNMYTSQELSFFERLSLNKLIDLNKVINYAGANNMSIPDITEKILKYDYNRARSINGSEPNYANTIPPDTSEIRKNNYFNAPYKYQENNNENINLSDGGLNFESNDYTLKGTNGLDLSIVTKYSTNNSSLYNLDIDKTRETTTGSVTGIIHYAHYLKNDNNGNIVGFYEDHGNGVAVTGYTKADVDQAIEEYKELKPEINGEYCDTDYKAFITFNVKVTENRTGRNFGYADSVTFSLGTFKFDYKAASAINEKYEELNNTTIDLNNGYSKTYQYRSGRIETITYSEYLQYGAVTYTENKVSYWDYYNKTTPTTYEEKQNNLGAGWSFGFSSLELNGSDKILHIGNGETYVINSGDNESHLKEYKLKDKIFDYDNASFTNGEITSNYVLKYKNGTKEYFSQDGRLLGIQDKYNNSIKFKHTQINNHFVINKIIDTVGREVTIDYLAPSTEGAKEVVITLPDNSKIKYILKAIPGEVEEYTLYKKIDQENRETIFNYDIKAAKFSLIDKSASKETKYALLKEIQYPTKGKSIYDYEVTPVTGNSGSQGVKEYYRISNRKEATLCEDNSYKYYNEKVYNYEKEYTGYPQYTDPENLPNTFGYTTTITDSNKIKTLYAFNNKNLLINTKVKNSAEALIQDTTTEHDLTTKLPIKVINKTYNEKNNAWVIEKVENYKYDDGKYGDLIGNWDVQADRDSNKMPINDEHKANYKYHPIYHYIIEKTYKKDNSTTIKEEYTPTSDGKLIEYSKVYENNVLKTQTQFLYDTYGNAIEERQYKRNAQGTWSDYISVKYDYNDNDTSRISAGTAFNGAYLTKKSINNIKDADGVLVASKSGNVQGIIDEVYKYDYLGNLKEKQDGKGSYSKYEYDKLGRILKQANPDGTFKSFVYNEYKSGDVVSANDNKNSVEVMDEEGNKIKVIYDKFGNQKYEQDVATGEIIKQYQYDENFRLKKEISNRGKVQNKGSIAEYEYYTDGRLKKKVIKEIEQFSSLTNFDNLTGKVLSSETYEYEDSDAIGQYSKVTKTVKGDANSPDIKISTYTDKAGRLRIQERNHEAQIYKDTFEYDYLGNKTEEKASRAYDESLTQSYTSKYDYDFAGRVIKQYNINGEYITTEYDDLGRIKSVTDIKGNKAAVKYSTTIEYDDLGRKIKETIPFENKNGIIYYSINKYHYDANGSLIKDKVTKNKPGEAEAYNETAYEYNSRNFLTKVITFDVGIPENYTQFYYDKVGNKLRMYTALSKPLTISGLDNVKDNGDNAYSVTKYEYDRFGKLLSKIDPLGKLESYQYDLLGNVVKKTDRNKSTIDMTYDGLNRVLATKVTTVDGKGNTATAYDYTLTGQRRSMVSGGVTTTSYYDDLGRLKKEQDTSGIIKQYDYDSANNRTLFVLKKNRSEISNTSYNYDNQSRIKDVLNKGKVIATYTYDYNGNRDALTYSNGNSVKYEYNLANKITQLTNKKGISILSNYSYSYNLDGNRAGENEAVKAKNKAYEYDGLSRLTTEAENSQLAANYDYDDNNNRNKMEMPDSFADFESSFKETVYTYNGLNQLTNITIGTLNAAYGYNGDGLRTSKVVDGIKTTHILDGQNIAAEIDGQGKTTEYIRGINLIASAEGANIRFYLYNGHGDVVHITDSTGNVIKNYEYDAFGNEKNIDVNDKNPFRYGGEYFDKETGLIYLRARYYDPKIGRFINEDSYWGKDSDPLSLNLYLYCNNDSVNRIDPSGFDSYIFYDSGASSGDGKHTFKDEADIRKKQLEEKYNTKVWLLDVADAKGFKTKWNSQVGFNGDGKQVSIDEVILIFHGSIGGSTVDGENGIGYMIIGKSQVVASRNLDTFNSKTDIAISDLDSKKMTSLYFSTCNSGNPDVINVADTFNQHMNISESITAWDGGTIFNYKTEQLEAGAYGGWLKESSRQKTYYKYVDKTWYGKPKRMRQGQVNIYIGNSYDSKYRI